MAAELRFPHSAATASTLPPIPESSSEDEEQDRERTRTRLRPPVQPPPPGWQMNGASYGSAPSEPAPATMPATQVRPRSPPGLADPAFTVDPKM